MREVMLGENKALSRLYYDEQDRRLGCVILVPIRHDPTENKTYYKPIAVVVTLSPSERDQIVTMLGGTPPCQS